MLGKLLKHEWLSTAKRLLPCFFIEAGLTILFICTQLFFQYMQRTSNTPEYSVHSLFFSGILLSILYFICFVTLFINTVILVCRFFASMVGSESYLTHTLPVKTSELLLSKFLNALAWLILSGAAALFFMLLCFGATQGFSKIRDFIQSDLFYEILDLISGEKQWSFFALIIFFVSLLIFGIWQVIASIALGQLMEKHRALCSVAFYFVISTIRQIVFSIVNIAIFNVEKIMIQNNFISFYSIYAILYLSLAAGLYFLSLHIFSKHLNLE